MHLDNLRYFLNPFYQSVWKEASDAVLFLNNNPNVRKLLFGLPISNTAAPTIQDTLLLYLFQLNLSRDQRTLALKNLNHILQSVKIGAMCIERSSKDLSSHQSSLEQIVNSTIPFANQSTRKIMVDYAHNVFPYVKDSLLINGGKSSYTFWCNIIGQDLVSIMKDKGYIDISIAVLFQRLAFCERTIAKRVHHRALMADSLLWFKNNKEERMTKLLQISSIFPSYFEDYVNKKFKNKQLDEIAYSNTILEPKCAKKLCKSKMVSSQKMHFVTLNVKNSGTGKLQGTAFTITNALSKEFMKKILLKRSKHLKFMEEMRQLHRERAFRFSSMLSSVKDHIWLQVGETRNCHLYIADETTAVENEILKISNFIYYHYTNFLYDEMKKLYGEEIAKSTCLPVSYSYFNSLVHLISNPQKTNWSAHSDGKHGLCILEEESQEALKDEDYDKVPFYMVVPTFSFQNYKEESTYLEFHDKSNSKESLGKLNASCGSLSMQLIGLQSNCKHSVKNRNEMNNTGSFCENDKTDSELFYKDFYNNLPTKRWVISVRSCSNYLQQHGYNNIL